MTSELKARLLGDLHQFAVPRHAVGIRSAMAQRYGLDGLAEAQACLVDLLLRQRLEQVIDVIHHQLQDPGQTLERLMGGGPRRSPSKASASNVRARRGQQCSTRQFAKHQPSAAMMEGWLPHRLQPWTSCAG